MFQLIDTLHQQRPGVICAGVVGTPNEAELALIDCGPESVFDGLAAQLRQSGFQPERVATVFLTHIHLDHGGGAWRWAREFGARIVVHPRGLPHLADPAKLLASAQRVFGDRLDALWGRIQPVPAGQLQAIEDGGEITVGGHRLRAVETSGHAPHHHAYWHDASRSLYAGDIAGVSIGGGPLLPPCPPPDIDLEAWRASLRIVRVLDPARILLTHGGILTGTAALDALETRLSTWSEWVLERLRRGETEAQMVPAFERFVHDELRRAGVDAEGVQAYEQGDPAAMSVFGLARYWRKHHPERLPAA